MNPEDFSQLLDDLEQRLGPKAEYLLDLAIRQVYVDFVLASIGMVVAIAAVVVAWKLGSRLKESYDREFFHNMTLLFGGVLVILFGSFWAYALSRALNPEFAAIERLLP